MAQRFQRSRHGDRRVTARLDDAERSLLRQLFSDVAAMLHDPGEPPAPGVRRDPLEELLGPLGLEGDDAPELPGDPALARLLPDASRDDADAAAEFRRLTEGGLRQRKREALLVAAATLDRVGGGREGGRGAGALVLDDAEATAWLTALNDVRLVVAERMGVRTEEDADRLAVLAELAGQADATDPTADPTAGQLAWMASVYDFLTWLQETLVGAVSAPGGRERR